MLKISTAVQKIVLNSEMAVLALESGCLNLSKYALLIQTDVEKLTQKQVNKNSIVAALTRIVLPLGFGQQLLPPIRIHDVAVKSGLIEVAYEKTQEHVKIFNALYCNRDVSASNFFMFTQGNGEIAVVVLEQVLPQLLAMFQPSEPKVILRDLAGLTMRFSETDVNKPNLLYSFLQKFAMKQLNIVEMISTYTELTLIVAQADVEKAFAILNKLHVLKS